MKLSINLNHLKVFEVVYRSQSMTLAAQELNLTQSGVSQHIKNLEEDLKTMLFERSSEKLSATPSADKLYKVCQQSFVNIQQTIDHLTTLEKPQIRGVVRIGIPVEFGNSMILPKLAEFGQKFPEVQFDLRYGFAIKMNQLILGDEIDFAFVDQYKMAPQIVTETIFQETLCLCVHKSKVQNLKKSKQHELAFLKQLPFVDYQKTEPVLRQWFQHHYGKKSFRLDIRAWAMDVQGLSKLILGGLGAGVLPLYVVRQMPQEELHIFKGNGETLVNQISIAYLKKSKMNQAAIAVLNNFRKPI